VSETAGAVGRAIFATYTSWLVAHPME